MLLKRVKKTSACDSLDCFTQKTDANQMVQHQIPEQLFKLLFTE